MFFAYALFDYSLVDELVIADYLQFFYSLQAINETLIKIPQFDCTETIQTLEIYTYFHAFGWIGHCALPHVIRISCVINPIANSMDIPQTCLCSPFNHEIISFQFNSIPLLIIYLLSREEINDPIKRYQLI